SKTQSDVLPVKISYVKNNNKLGKIIIVFGRVIPTANYDFKNKEIFKFFSQQLMEKIYSL
ncbi:MAG: hypothetical protein N2446_02075, partial [Elusimicrobiales bacterium]|nr:hypothetical protein [Elusimicrobiales bacterium]